MAKIARTSITGECCKISNFKCRNVGIKKVEKGQIISMLNYYEADISGLAICQIIDIITIELTGKASSV